jgi:hypothetical protein
MSGPNRPDSTAFAAEAARGFGKHGRLAALAETPISNNRFHESRINAKIRPVIRRIGSNPGNTPSSGTARQAGHIYGEQQRARIRRNHMAHPG